MTEGTHHQARMKRMDMDLKPPSGDQFVGIDALLRKAASDRPSDPFLAFNEITHSVSSMERQVQATAERLKAFGIEPGHRVVYVLPTATMAVIIFFAIIRLGALAVPVDWRTKHTQLRHVLRDSQPQLVLVEDGLYASMVTSEGTPGYELAEDQLVVGTEAHNDRIMVMSADGEQSVEIPEGVAAIIYTSGTSGPPKGVMVTERMFLSAAQGVIVATDLQDGDIFFQWEPFHHIGGLQMPIVCLLSRSSIHLVPTFSASRFWTQVRDARATHIHYLGGVLQMLLAQPIRDVDRGHRVRIAWGAGCTKRIWRRFEERFAVKIREVYGMTETASLNTANIDGLVGSIGKALPDFEIMLADDNGAEVPERERGEIWIKARRGDLLTPGYFQNTAATESLYNGPWLRTSDYAEKDSRGNIFFLGRMGDIIRRRGENISAWEVEHVVQEHPDIKDCAVIGIPNAILEDHDIGIFVELHDDTSFDNEEFLDWCSDRLPRHHVPRFINVVSEFPRGPSFRILKNKLSRDIEGVYDAEVARGRAR